ncbi:MAG: DHA2 family efflux MFS transporter permease subunit [Gammaproteobacteria bacterium]
MEPRGGYLSGGRLVLVTMSVCVAMFMEILDLSIVNVAVPAIAGSLTVSPTEGTWAISSYSLGSAVVQPLAGWLARRFGEVRTFCWSAGLFVLFSLLCGIAPNIEVLVACRLLQGVVSGPMIPLSQSLLFANYPPHLKGLATGIWAMIVMLAPICGPLIGGPITDAASWRWLFYINVPVGIFSTVVTWRLLRDRETATERQPVDWVGALLLVIGIGMLQYVLDTGQRREWFESDLIVACSLVSALAVVSFVIWEWTERHPMVEVQLFRNRNFAAAVVTLTVSYIAANGGPLIFPIWLQLSLGYTATWAGYSMAMMALPTIITMPLIGSLILRLPMRATATLGLVLFAASAAVTAGLNEHVAFGQLAFSRLLVGLSMAPYFIALTQISLSQIEPRQLASATSITNFLRTLAGSMGVAVSMTIWEQRGEYHHARLTELTAPQGLDQATGAIAEALRAGADAQVHSTLELLIQLQSRVFAFADAHWFFLAMFLACIPIVWLARPPFHAHGGGMPH